MKERDPLEALQAYYTQLPPQEAAPGPETIYRARIQRTQKAIGGICGFTCGLGVAALLLVWAARPSPASSQRGVAAIARMQMVNSGLAQRSASGWEQIR